MLTFASYERPEERQDYTSSTAAVRQPTNFHSAFDSASDAFGQLMFAVLDIDQ